MRLVQPRSAERARRSHARGRRWCHAEAVAWALQVALVLVACIGEPALAQPALSPAAGAVPQEGIGGSGHGWVVVPESRGGGFLLLHLPPREDPGIPGVRGSEAGTVRVVLRFETAPEALAAVGDRVFVVFRPALEQGELRRLVGSVTVSPGAIGDWWLYEPRDRLRIEASLPGDGTLVGLAGTPVGPAALIDRGPRETPLSVEGGDAGLGGEVGRVVPRPPPDLALRVLFDGEWREIRPPEAAGPSAPAGASPPEEGASAEPPTPRRYMLASWEGGVAVIATRPARHAMLWTAPLTLQQMREPDAQRRAEFGARRQEWEGAGRPPGHEPVLRAIARSAVAPTWEGRRYDWPGAPGQGWVLPSGPLAMVGDRMLFAQVASVGGEQRLTLYSASPEGAEALSALAASVAPGTGEGRPIAAVSAGVAALVPARRVAIVLAPAGVPGDRRTLTLDASLNLRIVEVSTDTGAVLYDGAMRTGAPLGRDQFQALLVVVLGLTALLLVWTIRAQTYRAVSMPPHSALAEPTTRLMAGLIDFLASAIITGWALGVPLSDSVMLRIPFDGDTSILGYLLGIASLLGIGLLMSTLTEGFFGRSPGKALMGLRVVVIAGPGAGAWRPPGLVRAFVRNLVRWAVAPIATIGLVSMPDARHWGDRATGTAVVTRDEPEEGDGSGGDSAGT